MGEASRIAQVPAHTLRYWEERLGLPRPARRPGGHRRYTRQDVETVLSIRDLVERRHLTLEGARRFLRRKPAAEAAAPAGSERALRVLREVKQDIDELIAEL